MAYQSTPGLFSDEHEIFRRRSVTSCSRKWNRMSIAGWRRTPSKPEFWRKAAKAGILCVDIPEEYGGPAAISCIGMVLAEELGLQRCRREHGDSIDRRRHRARFCIAAPTRNSGANTCRRCVAASCVLVLRSPSPTAAAMSRAFAHAQCARVTSG